MEGGVVALYGVAEDCSLWNTHVTLTCMKLHVGRRGTLLNRL